MWLALVVQNLLDRTSPNYGLKHQILLTASFVNKVLLNTAMFIHVGTVCGHFHATIADLLTCNRGHMACKA